MSVIVDLLKTIGLASDRTRLLTYEKVQADGVSSRWTRDLTPVGSAGVDAGELVELVSTVGAPATVPAGAGVRFDVLEEDVLVDDPVVSLLGTDAPDPPADLPREQRTTIRRVLGAAEALAEAVEAHKRAHPADFEASILVFDEPPERLGRSHVVTWWRAQRAQELLFESEMYFILNVAGRTEDATERVLDVRTAGGGTPIRLTGTVVDREPFVARTPESVAGAAVRLGGRTATTGANGAFVLDARLGEGTHALTVGHTGVDGVELSVVVEPAAGDALTVTVRATDGSALATATTAGPPTDMPALRLALTEELELTVHKLRGTVVWPQTLAAPSGMRVTPAAAGALPAGRHFYRVTAVNALGESLSSKEVDITLAAAGGVDLAWTAVPGATGYRVYRGAASGAQDRFFASAAATFRDVGGATTAGAPPAVDYPGTPLAGRRVYLAPLEEAPTAAQRPASSRAPDPLTARRGRLRSPRRARPVQDEATAADGAFEVKYVDVSLGRRWLMWVESPAAAGGPDLPEQIVRTIDPADGLRELTDGHETVLHGTRTLVRVSDLEVDIHRQLVDARYNLTADEIAWGVDALRAVDWEADPANPDPNTVDARVVRPAAGSKADFDAPTLGEGLTVERLEYDAARKLVSGVRLKSLPLVPVFESAERQSGLAQEARAGLAEDMDGRFLRRVPPDAPPDTPPQPSGHHAADVRWVLDGRRLPGGNHVERCDLLESTFVRRPDLPPADEPRWRADAISLSDHAAIGAAAAPATRGNRQLQSTWIAALRPVLPRLLGLSANRNLYVAPGHGLYQQAAPANLAGPLEWWSERGGGINWYTSGEDENASVMSAHVKRIAEKQGSQVWAPRELDDLSAPGVDHAADAVFNVVGAPEFMRLWHQSPVYWAAHVWDPAHPGAQLVLGTNMENVRTGAGASRRKWADASNVRVELARRIAADVHLYLAVHTNGGGLAQRGTQALFLDVSSNPPGAAHVEDNTLGHNLAERLVQLLAARCSLVPVGAEGTGVVSYRLNNRTIAELENTYPHFRSGDGAAAQRHSAAAAGLNQHGFPTAAGTTKLPVALIEVGFHSHPEEGRLLADAWFRRLAAEAMAFAAEEQLGDAASVTGAELVAMLGAAYGPAAAAAGGPADANAVDGPTVRARVLAATGVEPPAPPAAPALRHVVTAVDQARDGFTRRQLVEALRDGLVGAAGYVAPADDALINQFVTGPIVGGAGISDLKRPSRPVTRLEAGELVASAVGLTPATLDTVLATPFGAAPLIEQLPGGPHAERYVTAAAGAAIATAVAALQAEQFYRAVEVRPLGSDLRAIDELLDRPAHFRIALGEEVRWQATTRGAAWKTVPAAIEFELGLPGGGSRALGAESAEPRRLISKPWSTATRAQAAGYQAYTVSVWVRHPTRGRRRIGVSTLQLEFA